MVALEVRVDRDALHAFLVVLVDRDVRGQHVEAGARVVDAYLAGAGGVQHPQVRQDGQAHRLAREVVERDLLEVWTGRAATCPPAPPGRRAGEMPARPAKPASQRGERVSSCRDAPRASQNRNLREELVSDPRGVEGVRRLSGRGAGVVPLHDVLDQAGLPGVPRRSGRSRSGRCRGRRSRCSMSMSLTCTCLIRPRCGAHAGRPGRRRPARPSTGPPRGARAAGRSAGQDVARRSGRSRRPGAGTRSGGCGSRTRSPARRASAPALLRSRAKAPVHRAVADRAVRRRRRRTGGRCTCCRRSRRPPGSPARWRRRTAAGCRRGRRWPGARWRRAGARNCGGGAADEAGVLDPGVADLGELGEGAGRGRW